MSSALAKIRLRANPAYRAMPWNRLSPDAREQLSADADSYGVLIPADGTDLPVMAIDRDTALLFLSLNEPGPAPDFVFTMGEEESERILRRLVFDSILQVEHGKDEFISGPAAWGVIGGASARPEGALARLSIEALNYAARLSHADGSTLAQKLYSYNRRPATPASRRRFPGKAACLAFLGLKQDGGKAGHIARFWSAGDEGSPWLAFTRRHSERPRGGHSCKLYVGLAFEHIPELLPVFAEAVAVSGGSQFKVASDLDGLLRPDKLVAYFPSKESLFAAAQTLLPAVSGKAVQAVPFSAEIAPSGALSWGMDPKAGWFGDRASWRQWVCEKLAAALVAARSCSLDGVEPWQFALERLSLEGVDAATFMPTGAWSGTA